MTNVNVIRKGLVFKTAQDLLLPNNKTTTLEIKTQLRLTNPEYYWDQSFVSTCMDEFSATGVFNYVNMGSYRTYSDPKKSVKNPTKNVTTKTVTVKVSVKPSKTSKVSKTKALDLMQNSKGKFFTVTFNKKGDGTVRTLNCQYMAGQKITGNIIKVKEASLLLKKDPNPMRSFDLNTLKKLSISGQVYNIK